MSSQDIGELKTIWNEISDTYETRSMLILSQMYHSFLDFPDYSSVDKILDAGCGPGTAVDKILSRAKPTAELVGSDISEGMIEKANARTTNSRVSFVVANNEYLPFQDEEFDLYLSNMCLMLVSEPMNMLKEAYRITKTGSYSIFSVIGAEGGNISHDLVKEAFKEVNHVQKIRSFSYISDHSILKSMCKEAGFSKAFTYSSLVPFHSLEVDPIMDIYKPLPNIRELEGTDKYDDFMRILRGKVEEILMKGETINLSFIVCIAIK